MTISTENTAGGPAVMLAKVRRLIQDTYAQDQVATDIGVGRAALLTMLQAEETRLAALT